MNRSPTAPMTLNACAEATNRAGFAVVRGVAPLDVLRDLLLACPAIPQAGLRDLLNATPMFRQVAELPSVKSLVSDSLGRPGFVTRAILFDKTPAANWALGFHQDVVIAVTERFDTTGFGPWSVKAGIPHVRPPAAVLERMVTVRVHLDDCGPENGPLAVIPGSHTCGFLDDSELERRIAAGPIVECPCRAGDAVLMRPLLLHGSRKAESPSRRRVVHLEFAADPLPPPLRWREGV
jgi:ectoine hydroxylase-related dioxygenase (phytanoyl-CoA dioxygenase family)